MRKQIVQMDRLTGRAIVAYIDCGRGRAIPGHGRTLTPCAVTSHSPAHNATFSGGSKVARCGGCS